MKVAETTLALLELGFEQVDRFAIAFVALAALFELGLEKILLVAVENVADKRLVELGVELFVTGEKTRVEDRGLFLEVFRRPFHAFGRVAHRMPDRQTGIPQRVQNYFADDLDIRAGFVVMEEEQINIRVGSELLAAVSTAGRNRDPLIEAREAASMMNVGKAEECAQEIVDRSGVVAHDLESACAGQMALEQLRTDGVEMFAGDRAGAAVAPEFIEQRRLVAPLRAMLRRTTLPRRGMLGDGEVVHRLPTAASALK